MKKALTIVLGIIGVLSIVFLGIIISTGDEAIELGEAETTVNIFMYIAYSVLILTLAFVVVFSLKNILTDSEKLKSTLKGVGLFLVLAAICYFGLATGEETVLKDGDILSEGGSKLLGAGLYLFYALILSAGGFMLFFGIKKMIN